MTVTIAQGSLAERTGTDYPPSRLFIGGEWTDSATGNRRELLDPGTGQLLTTVAEASAPDVGRAVRAARAAFDEGEWSGLTFRRRGRVLLRAAELIREHAEEFARLESANAGHPILFSRLADVPGTADQIEYYGMLAASVEGSVRHPEPVLGPSFSYTLKEAIGVVAAITPFNFPLILSMTKIAAALAAGNTIVHKPAEETPLTALRLAELLAEAGVPAGVYNVVTGGPEAGSALIEDPRVDKIAFTGSTAVGRRIAESAGRNLKRATVELGGKSANLVFADADLESAIDTTVNGFTFNAGQFCMAGSRVLVQRPIYNEFVGALAEATFAVPVGDPFAEWTIVGPMTGPRHQAKVLGVLDAARAAGVEVLGAGAEAADPGEPGFFVRPAVLAGVAQDSSFVQEEIFGPVVTVQPFDTEDEAVRLANGTNYGLAGGVQTGNVARAHRVASALRAGIVWVNAWGRLDSSVPFGGYRDSGYGRECGPEGLDEYLTTKSVVVGLD